MLFRPHSALAALAISVAFLISLSTAESTVALGPAGSCPVLVEATVEAQPVVYSQFIESNTAIAPFNDGFTYVITNAPIAFVVSTTMYVTDYTTGSSAPTTVAQTTELRLGDGLPSGTVTNLPRDTSFVLGWVGLNLPPKRELDDEVEARDGLELAELSRRNPVQNIPSIQNAAAVAQAGSAGNWMIGNSAAPITCSSATAYSLVNGQLLHGGSPVGKYQGDTVVALGAATNGNTNPVINVGFSLINGLLAWQPPDVGLAVFYSCGGTVYAVFDPTNNGLAVAPYGNCSLVAIGGLSSTSCTASLNVLPVPSIKAPSFTVPSISSINPTGFLSVQTPRVSSVDIGGIVGVISSSSIPSQLPSISIGSLSLNTALPSLSSINLAPSSISSIVIPSTISLAVPSLSSLIVPSQPPSLSSINLAPPSLSSLVIPSQPPSLSSINLAPPSITIPSTINLASPSLSSLVIPSQPPSISSINLALPSITIPSTINLSPPSLSSLNLTPPSITIPSSINLTTSTIILPSISVGSLSIPSLAPPTIIVPTALPSLSIQSPSSISIGSISVPSPQISLPSLSTTITINLQSSSVVLNLSPPSNSPISLAPPTIPVVTIPTPLSIPTPQISLPSGSIPSISVLSPGSLSLPSVSLPSPGSISLPSVSLPSASILAPGTLSLPSGTLPSISLPAPGTISLPSGSLSLILPTSASVSLPNLSLPSAGSNTLSGTLPSFTLPNITFSFSSTTTTATGSN